MRSGGRPRTEVPKLGHPTGKDVVAGFVPVCSAFPKGWPRRATIKKKRCFTYQPPPFGARGFSVFRTGVQRISSA